MREGAMQREDRFAISKPPPIFYGVLSILVAFVLVMAAIRYWPEPRPIRTDSALHQLKRELRSLFREVDDAFNAFIHLVHSLAPLVKPVLLWMTIFAMVLLPLLSFLVLYRKRQASSPL